MTYSSTLQEIVHWLVNVPARPWFKAILKLVFQGAVYFIWRERNSRLLLAKKKKKLSFALWCEHTKPATQIVKEIQLQVRAKLLGLDREKPSSSLRNPLSPPGLIDFKLERSSLFCAVNFLLHTSFILFIVYLRFFN